MFKRKRSNLLGTVSIAIPVCGLLIAGCSKSEQSSTQPAQPGGNGPGTRMGNPGSRGPDGRGPGGRGPGGPGGGRFQPVAANATAPQIFQQKCQRCHGEHGQGGRGPNLIKQSQRPAAELRKIIHDGHDRMPSFANQMTAAQLDSVVAYIKQLKAPK